MSTIYNIYGFLCEARNVIKRSESINRLFLIYVSITLCSSVLNPAVTILVLIGGWKIAFDISFFWSFTIGVLIPLLYTLYCLWCCPNKTVLRLPSENTQIKALLKGQYSDPSFKKWRESTQLQVAAWLSGIYALVMLAVTIGVVIEMTKMRVRENPLSLLLIFVIAIIFLTAIFHKQLNVLLNGIVYLVALPSAYIFLSIFVIVNSDVTDWGTRENSISQANQNSNDAILKKIKDIEEKYSENERISKIRREMKKNQLKIEQKKSEVTYVSKFSLAQCYKDVVNCLCFCFYRHVEPEQTTIEEQVETAHILHEIDEEKQAEQKEKTTEKKMQEEKEQENEKDEIKVFFQNIKSNDAKYQADKEIPLETTWYLLHHFGESYVSPSVVLKKVEDDLPNNVFSFRNRTIALYAITNCGWITVILVLSFHAELDIFNYNVIGLFAACLFMFVLFLQFISMLWHRLGTLLEKLASFNTTQFPPPKDITAS